MQITSGCPMGIRWPIETYTCTCQLKCLVGSTCPVEHTNNNAPKHILGPPIPQATLHTASSNFWHVVIMLDAINRSAPIVVNVEGSIVFANTKVFERSHVKSLSTSMFLYRLSTKPRPAMEKPKASMLIMRHALHMPPYQRRSLASRWLTSLVRAVMQAETIRALTSANVCHRLFRCSCMSLRLTSPRSSPPCCCTTCPSPC